MAKQRVVSKKELEDSGLSLRDFLNKERGLTRRKDKAEKSELGAEMGVPMTRDESASARRSLGSNPAEEAKMDKLNRSYGSRSSSKLSDVVRPGTNTNYENKEVSDMGMKRGGMTSSASKRADGCCVKGKTKGKMV